MASDEERELRVAQALARNATPAQHEPGALGLQVKDGALAAPSARLRSTSAGERAGCRPPHVSAAARDAIRRSEELGAVVLLPGDPDFPDRVLLGPDPPRLLFATGKTGLLRTPGVAIVGSRDHSPYGAAACAQVVVAAVAARATVISGLARGIDAVAHREALLLGGDTIAVLGHGVDLVYPRVNHALYREVQARGLLVSEYPPGTPPARHTFLRRNRIIAALSTVSVVVEAGAKSGALTTAEAALERGCDVMAVPGPITSPTHVGCNRLIRDGATPFLEARDLWDLMRVPADRPPVIPLRPLSAILPGDLSRDERSIALHLADGECSLDELGQVLDAPAHDLSGALLGLELRGVVETRPGRRFRLAEPWRAP